jgi:branched-chain amino acid transport system substrate-binding protein
VRARDPGPVALAALALLATACPGGGGEDRGADPGEGAAEADEPAIEVERCAEDPTRPIEGDEIVLVSSYPQSGAPQASAEVARGWKSYFDRVNDEGGVEIAGRRYTIAYRDRDDRYDPARTAENVGALVPPGSDVLAVFGVLGTPNNLAVRERLGEMCVPNVFASTGSPAWGDPAFPWTLGSTLPPYPLEGALFAGVLAERDPDATVAMLVQDDEFGRAYEEGFRRAIEGTAVEVVKVERYALPATDMSAPVARLAATGADAFFDGATLIACPDALTRAAEAGWEPITWVSTTCTGDISLGLAGEAAEGAYSAFNLMDQRDPRWADHPAMVEFLATIDRYRPDGFRPTDGLVGYGYTQAAVLVEALAQMEAPTRLALMTSVRALSASDAGLLLPGVRVRTGEDDPYLGETLQVGRYTAAGGGGHFAPVGDPVELEGRTPALTPGDLVSR